MSSTKTTVFVVFSLLHDDDYKRASSEADVVAVFTDKSTAVDHAITYNLKKLEVEGGEENDEKLSEWKESNLSPTELYDAIIEFILSKEPKATMFASFDYCRVKECIVDEFCKTEKEKKSTPKGKRVKGEKGPVKASKAQKL